MQRHHIKVNHTSLNVSLFNDIMNVCYHIEVIAKDRNLISEFNDMLNGNPLNAMQLNWASIWLQ